MKFLGKISSIIFLSVALSGCVQPEEKLEKTHLAYTYQDVCSNYYRTSNAIPNQGEPELLILPIYFNDSSDFIPIDKKDVVKSDLEKAFFGTKEDVGFESVSSYYSALSCEKCKLKGTVSNWLNIDESYRNYFYDESKTTTLVTNAVDKYFSESNDIRSRYDLDKNGFLDGVVLIYAGPDSDNLSKDEKAGNLWAYTNWISTTSDVNSPKVCSFMWASYDFMYSKSTANEKLGNECASGDSTNSKLILDTHVFIHEVGHMFGLVDYYDYSYKYSPAGAFSMQDHNIGSHDPYSVMALGWCDPYIPTKSCTITLNTFQSSRDCIVLSNSWNDINSPFDEYLLVEFYSPDGLNQFDHEHAYQNIRATGADECGIRLWHVDARLVYDTYKDPSKFTCDPKIKNSRVMHMMSNTYGGSTYARGYTTPLGNAYTNYNILQLIRNEETMDYQPHYAFDNLSLFKNGKKFTMNTFGKQFVNKAKLNSNKVLGWNFSVEIADNQAIIHLNRTI